MGLKSLRIKNSFSQEKLAELSKLSTRTIQRIEKENKVSLESLNALAEVFNLDKQILKELIENPNEEIKGNNFFDRKVKIYLLVNIFLFIINISTNPSHLWFMYPLFAWGIPLFYKKLVKTKL